MAKGVIICRSNDLIVDPRVEKTTRALINAGYSVVALGWDRNGGLPEIEDQNGLQVVRIKLKVGLAVGLMNLGGVLGWQWVLLMRLLKLRKSYEVIHACDFDTVLPAIFMKVVFRKKVVYDIFDFYSDNLRRTPIWLRKFICWVDRGIIRQVDAVILADESRLEQIQPAKPKRWVAIYNSPRDVLDELEGRNKDEAFTITYVGLLQFERGLLPLLEVLRSHTEWRLDLAGFGGDQDLILAEALELPNVNWHGRVAYSDALRLGAAGDVLFAMYDPNIPNHKYASPNKLFEAMMLDKPVVVAEGTGVDVLVREYECGIVVPYGDVDSLAGAIGQLESDPGYAKKLGENGRRVYLEKYNWGKMEAALIEIYQQVLLVPENSSPI